MTGIFAGVNSLQGAQEYVSLGLDELAKASLENWYMYMYPAYAMAILKWEILREISNSLLQYKTHFKYTWHDYNNIDSLKPINNKEIHIHIHWMNYDCLWITHIYACIYLNQILVCLRTHKDNIFVLQMGHIRANFCFTLVALI